MPRRSVLIVSSLVQAFAIAGCALPVATVATTVGTSVASNVAIGGVKRMVAGSTEERERAKAAYERAPRCADVAPHGVQNGVIVTIVHDVAWFDVYEAPGGKRIGPSRGNALMLVDYEIVNRADDAVVVSPRRLLVARADGATTREASGVAGSLSEEQNAAPDDSSMLGANQSTRFVAVFDVPRVEHALLVPNGRKPGDPPPTWLDGCRFAGPDRGT